MPPSNKTEKPTPKRIEDARKKGQVAKSNDLNGAVVLTMATILFIFVGPYTYQSIMGVLRTHLEKVLLLSMTKDGFLILINSAVQESALLLLPFLIGISAIAVLSNLLQIKPMFSMKAIQPKFSKLNPVQGFKRMFSMRSVVEVVKALLKMGVIGLAGTLIIQNRKMDLYALNQVEPAVAMQTILSVLGTIAGAACVLFLIIGAADFAYQKYEMNKQLKMTKQEVKDERKSAEGDPQMKRRIREVGIQMTRKRQIQNVPTADVIVTNPTHYSVAIQYNPDISPAPRVVAKGQDHFALKIREVAKEHSVPIVENKPLARSLFAVVDVEETIPPEMFVAVAEVLAYVFSRKKGRKTWKKKSSQGTRLQQNPQQG